MEFTEDQLKKIRNFKWNDEEEGAESQPGIAIAEDVIDCAKSISQYVLDNIGAQHYENGRFIIPIPLELHRLLCDRYSVEWTDDSRSKIFELIRGVFSTTMDADQGALTHRINNKVFPKQASESVIQKIQSQGYNIDGKARKEYEVRWAKLYDEPSMSMTVGMCGDDKYFDKSSHEIVVEIEVV